MSDETTPSFLDLRGSADFRPLRGSDRGPVPDVQLVGPVTADHPITVTLVLRRRAELPAELVTGQRTLRRDELARDYGADPADAELVGEVLQSFGLTVAAVDLGSRRVQLSGDAVALAAVFGAELTRASTTDPATGEQTGYRYRRGELRVPDQLHGVVVAVLGLDDRPQARTRFRVAAARAVTTAYTPPQLGTVYAFPPGADGSGQTLAIVELGGGFDTADLTTYFGDLGLAPPQVTAVPVDGAGNAPGGDPQGADGEVLLDIEIAGGLAPGAGQLVYFAPNTDRGFLDAVSTAVHADPTPAALSISWGQAETAWTAQARDAMDAVFADAAALGVTVCVAAGDGGSSDGQTDGRPHVDFPATSPHVLACGGTSLQADPVTGAVRSETVWNNGPGRGATGGGVSRFFARPAWQDGIGVPDRPGGGPGRGVPDIAGNADPATGYRVLVDGVAQVIGGTSAVAPLWAALVCCLVQAGGRPLGLLQPTLYAAAASPHQQPPTPGLRDITVGDNGDYAAGPGWDACTGLGVPVGTELVGVVTGSAGAASGGQ